MRVTFLALLIAFTASAERVERDWHNHPAIVVTETTHDIYALGDIHGDCDRMLEILAAAQLIPTSHEAKWTGGKAILICTGDVIDKYDHAIPAIAALRKLQSQAAVASGQVIVTMGNHEAEFLAGGGENKKAKEFIKELTEAKLNPAEVAAGRDAGGLGAWLRELPIGAKVNDWFFCHAGNTGGLTLATLTERLEQQISAEGFGAPILADANSMLEARMHPRPWWEADSSISLKEHQKEKDKEKHEKDIGEPKLLATVEALGCKHLVFGHQPGKVTFGDGSEREEGRLSEYYHGLVFFIDTGMSRGVSSGKLAILKIHVGNKHTTASVITADGKAAPLWP